MRAFLRDLWLFPVHCFAVAVVCAALLATGCSGGGEDPTPSESTPAPAPAENGQAAAPPQSFTSLDQTLADAATAPSTTLPAMPQPHQPAAAPATETIRLTGRLQRDLVLPPVPDPAVDEQVKNLLQIAVSAQEKEDYGPARQFFQQALGVARQNWAADHWRVRDIELAIQYQDQLAALTPEQRTGIREATRLHMLAYQRAAQNEFDMAIDFLNRAQAIRVPILGEQHMTCLRARSDYLQWTIKLGNFEEAQRLAPRVLEESIALSGEVHPETALLLWSLGDMQVELGNPAEADRYYERALYTLRTAPYSDADYPQFLLRLANTYQAQQRYLDAEQCMLEAAEIRRLTKGETAREYVGTLMTLGTLYLNANQHALADAVFAQVITRSQGDPELATLRATVLVYLGRSAIEQGNLTRAAAQVEEALALREASSGRRDPMYAGVLFLRADIHMRQGNYEQAKGQLIEAARVYDTLGRAGLASHSACIHRVVLCDLELGNVQDAREMSDGLVRAHLILLGEDDPIVQGDKALVARVCLAEGNAAQAETLCREAVAALAGNPNQQIRHSFCLHALGDVLAAQGRTAEAAEQIENALAVQHSLLRVADLHMLFTTESYAATLHQLGRNDEAASYEAQAALYRGTALR